MSGFYTDHPEAPSVPKPIIDAIAPPEFRSAIVDTMYKPRSELLAYITGMTWVTDYYSRVVASDDEASGLDVHVPAPLQQYNRIWSMELKVQQELQTTFSDDGTEQKTVGTAYVYPFLTPQPGDMFRADIGDGREGMFRVFRVTPQSMFMDRVHEIEYELISKDNPLYIGNLENRVQVTYRFVKDFLLNHQNPLLVEEDYHSGQTLSGEYYDLIYLYEQQYISREFRTLILPGEKDLQNPVYDHGFVDFVLSILESREGNRVRDIRRMNFGDDSVINAVSLWDMLLRRDKRLMEKIYTMVGLTPARNLLIPYNRTALLHGAQWTNIKNIIYPIDPMVNVDVLGGWEKMRPIMSSYQASHLKRKLQKQEWMTDALPGFLADAEDPPEEPIVKDRPVIHSVDLTKTYVLSRAFYEGNYEGMSLLESLLMTYLKHEVIRNEDVLKVAMQASRWKRLDQYYLIPLTLLLIRYAIRRI